ncbi:hypothetical protein D3C85_1825050 [compost metagenome]
MNVPPGVIVNVGAVVSAEVVVTFILVPVDSFKLASLDLTAKLYCVPAVNPETINSIPEA